MTSRPSRFRPVHPLTAPERKRSSMAVLLDARERVNPVHVASEGRGALSGLDAEPIARTRGQVVRMASATQYRRDPGARRHRGAG